MDLFEYQGKELYRKYNILTPKSIVINNLEDLQKIDGTNLNYPLVIKAQVQVGGRGKAGGIKLVNNEGEMITASNEILGMDIKGHIVEKLLIEEASEIEDEYYISFTLDRSSKQYLMLLSSKGGMDIEEVAEKNPELAEEIDAPQIEGESTCLHCNKSMGLCAHCFCKDVYYQLIGKDKEIAQEFLSRFDYELRVNLI